MATRGNAAHANPIKDVQYERYAQARAQGKGKKESYYAAGWDSKSPYQQTARLEKNKDIVGRIKWLLTDSARQTTQTQSVTRGELNSRYDEVYLLAIKGVPALDRNNRVVQVKSGDEEVDLYRPDLAAANSSIAGKAKLNGLSLDVSAHVEDLDSELDSMTDDEIRSFAAAALEQVDPSLRKKIIEKKTKVEAESGSQTEDETGGPTLQ